MVQPLHRLGLSSLRQRRARTGTSPIVRATPCVRLQELPCRTQGLAPIASEPAYPRRCINPVSALHAALSLEQGLGSIVQYGRQSRAQCRAQRPVTPAPSCPGWQGVDVTFVSSVTPLHCAVVRLMLWEWLNASIGCDVPSEKSVKAVTGLMPSWPRAIRRIGTSSEALWRGASGESENRYLI